jgi:hypothetical protein
MPGSRFGSQLRIDRVFDAGKQHNIKESASISSE